MPCYRQYSKDHYDVVEVNSNKPKKNCLDDVKCHDFILTNQYGEKVYASSIRTRKIPLKWDVNCYVEKEKEKEKEKEYEWQKESSEPLPFEKNRRSYHVPYNTDNTGESDYSLDNLSEDHINSFSPFTEYGSRFGNKSETSDKKPSSKTKEKYLKVPNVNNIIGNNKKNISFIS
ncbi:hypothetical protein PIROE2DRAFT_14130 [Piromyces sp. E2]|nr:hypothetical protein PIROE2DRAFT_14130 [Piromyces sp. E2]|eukprot:OUM60178.1 hypothetical protein PIROE2DRAFT_14130 [Piromyces sp. E2]